MKALSLLAVLLAALAASACRKPIKAAEPDWNKTRENATRSHGSLDKETAD